MFLTTANPISYPENVGSSSLLSSDKLFDVEICREPEGGGLAPIHLQKLPRSADEIQKLETERRSPVSPNRPLAKVGRILEAASERTTWSNIATRGFPCPSEPVFELCDRRSLAWSHIYRQLRSAIR